MTVEEKTIIVNFLNLASDYIGDGYRRDREEPEVAKEPGPTSEELSSLPLVYQIDEDGEDLSDEDSFDDSLEAVVADINACKACDLAETRTFVVPGEGAERPLVMVIGEGPGADEDRAGRPFVGRAGQLLDKMLESIGLSRNKNCFIGNMVKCRPPGNRDPGPEEIAACSSFLERQITLLRPKIILCVGRVAAQALLKTNTGINALRGEFKELSIGETKIPVLCTFHPSAVLRNESLKRPAWEDLKLLKSRLGNGE